MGETILIADDDRHLVRMTRLYLVNQGYDVAVTPSGGDVLRDVREVMPDLVILSRALSGIDVFDTCQEIREESDVPIIVTSPIGGDADLIASLERGADDFVARPFSPRELVARVKAVLRRTQAPPRPQRIITLGDLRIDGARREALVRGRPVKLRAKELRLLQALASHPGMTVTREQLLRTVWGGAFNGNDRTLTVHVAWLRAKLSNSGVQIVAVRGVGYRLTIG